MGGAKKHTIYLRLLGYAQRRNLMRYVSQIMQKNLTIKEIDSTNIEMLQQVSCLEYELFDDAWRVSSLQETLMQYGTGLLVALDDQKNMMGYCVYQIVFDMAEVLRIATRPSYQGCGVGGFLLGAVDELCLASQVESILLEVRADNTPALGLYQKVGFVQIDVRPNYYRTKTGRIDALILQKYL